MSRSCTCEKCVEACKGQPGWFAHGEAEKAADLLGMTFDDFKRFIIKDHCDNQEIDDAIYVWAPRKVGVDLPEHEIRLAASQHRESQCIFLENDRCRIHAAKPFECKRAMVCEPPTWADRVVRTQIEDGYRLAGAPLGMRPPNG